MDAVQELQYPPSIELPITGSLGLMPQRNARRWPDRVVFARDSDGGRTPVTAVEFHADVTSAARGLIARGIAAGSAVAILSPNRYEWTVLDFAIWAVGAHGVPIYETSSAEQIEWMVTDSGSTAVIVDSADAAARVREALPSPPPIWIMDDGLLAALAAEGAAVPADDLAARTAAVTPQDLATIVYTSGTTGRPKGCELTHENLLFVVRTLVASTGPVVTTPGARTIQFLPLAHILGRGAQVFCVEGGMQVAYCADTKSLPADMLSVRPTFLVGVPRVFEKIYNGAQQKAHAAGKGRIFERAATVAIEMGRARAAGGPSLRLRLEHAIFDHLVYSKLRQAMGGDLRFAITGGANLGERLGAFFAGIGVVVMEGYGMTESTASGTFNRADTFRVGTVGEPMPGTAVRIAADGEIHLRGPHVMRGYHDNPAATAEALDPEGWLRTGDIGALDADGFLRITGRKKEIIVTAGGKNVAPAVLEDRIQAHHLISHAMVVGEGRPFIGALITLDPPAVEAWAMAHGRSGRTVAELRDDPDLRALVQAAVDDANRAVSRAESIRAWRVLDGQLTEEAGFVTATQKLKRAVVTARYADEIEALYRR